MKGTDGDQRKVYGSLAFSVAALVVGAGAALAGSPMLGLAVLVLLVIVQGCRALRDSLRRRGMTDGESFGFSIVAIGVLLVGVFYSVLTPNCTCDWPRARRMMALNNMKNVGLALLNYRETHGRLPPAVVYGPEGQPLYSWRVLILPHLKQQELFDEFHLDEPWDSPHNRKLGSTDIPLYGPLEGPYMKGLTYIQAFVGPGTAFEGREGPGEADFSDGKGTTLLVVEGGYPIEWSRPLDLPYSPVTQVPPLGGEFKVDGSFPFRYRREVFFAVLADGSVRTLRRTMPEATLRALITRNGGEVLADGDY